MHRTGTARWRIWRLSSFNRVPLRLPSPREAVGRGRGWGAFRIKVAKTPPTPTRTAFASTLPTTRFARGGRERSGSTPAMPRWPATSAPPTPSVSACARSAACPKTMAARSPRSAVRATTPSAICGCARACARRCWSSSPTPMPSVRSGSTAAMRCGRSARYSAPATRTTCRCSRA